MTLRFGKYRGCELSQLPDEYLAWLAETSERTAAECRQELERRAVKEEASLPWAQRLLKVGLRELAKRHHPDCGGSNDEMRQVNAAYEALQSYVRQNGIGRATVPW